MKISHLIERLHEYKEVYGDINVCIVDNKNNKVPPDLTVFGSEKGQYLLID